MYSFYLANVLLPVAPSKLSIKIKNANKTLNLIGEGEINFLKTSGLSDISFDVLIPSYQYPFTIFTDGFKPPTYFLEIFEKLKNNKKPFQFVITRNLKKGKLFDSNFKVSLESYDINEDSKNGFDIIVSIKLKQYRGYATKVVSVNDVQNEDGLQTIKIEAPRESKEIAKTYTVVRGDSLWIVAKTQMDNGGSYQYLYEINKTIIDTMNEGTGNPKFTIYPGQVLKLG